MASQQAVKIIQELAVSPPVGSVPTTSLPLTFLDIGWLQGDAMKRVLFYDVPNLSTSHFVDEVLPKLTSSLSFALQHFFPFAGKVRLSPNSVDQFELYYDSDAVAGVPFTVAEANKLDFDYLAGDGDLEPPLLRQLAPSLKPSGGDDAFADNLLAVQATVFPGRGISISTAFNHLVCDGSGYVHFLKTWANTCRNSSPAPPPPSPPPLFDRSFIQDPNGSIYKTYLNYMREYAQSHSKKKMISVESPPDLVLATLTLSKEAIEKLKTKLIAKNPRTHCSTFVVSCAYVWVCLVKSRNYDNDEEVHFACAADVKPGMNPPVTENYFGNCLLLSTADTKTAGELTGEEGFVAAAEAIASGIKKFKEDPMRDAKNSLMTTAKLMEKRPMTVAGSPKFRVYDVDFGWGSPEKTEVLSILDTGAVSVAESKDKRGGIQVGVVCSRSEMEIFRSHFTAGLH